MTPLEQAHQELISAGAHYGEFVTNGRISPYKTRVEEHDELQQALRVAAVIYGCQYLLRTTSRLIDGGELHRALADHVRDVLAIAHQRPRAI